MLMPQLYTKKYEHEYWFDFKGKRYRVHSVVKLTDEGRSYLEMSRKEVILTEVFHSNFGGKKMWTYLGDDIRLHIGVRDKSTDVPPDELIEEVIEAASQEYASREILGANSPYFATGEKNVPKDWDIPEVKMGWIIFILVFIGAFIFRDWYVQLIIRLIAGIWFFGYRKAQIDARTTYTHNEDDDIIKAKFKALYGLESNEDKDDNEENKNGTI